MLHIKLQNCGPLGQLLRWLQTPGSPHLPLQCCGASWLHSTWLSACWFCWSIAFTRPLRLASWSIIFSWFSCSFSHSSCRRLSQQTLAVTTVVPLDKDPSLQRPLPQERLPTFGNRWHDVHYFNTYIPLNKLHPSTKTIFNWHQGWWL